MTRAKVINLFFQLLAAFWAVIVITHAHVSKPWHAYLAAVLGVVVISVVGTRLKHRILSRANAISSDARAATQPQNDRPKIMHLSTGQPFLNHSHDCKCVVEADRSK